MASRVVALLLPYFATAARVARSADQPVRLLPANPNLIPVAVIMNPGGTVAPSQYEDAMKMWQEEAEKKGMSMWITVLQYLGDLSLPFFLKNKFNAAVKRMKSDGLPSDAPVYFTGHSMGGGASQPVQKEMYDDGLFQGVIFQASYILRSFFPPISDTFSYLAPTLTIGGSLNFGTSRPTRMAEAYYRQSSMADKPVVLIMGMNHMQFATGFWNPDLKPEISTEDGQREVAQVSIDWISQQMGISGGSLVQAKVAETATFLKPIVDLFVYEGGRGFNVPNQVDTPGSSCPRGICPEGSQFAVDVQGMMVGNSLRDSGNVEIVSNFADLFPWRLASREPRKPFITQQGDKFVIETYVMAPMDEKDFKGDIQKIVAVDELAVKMVSRQNAALQATGAQVGKDDDTCRFINQEMYEFVLAEKVDAKSLLRYNEHGQKLTFGPTDYKGAGPLWFDGKLAWKDQGDTMMVSSTGLFTTPGDKIIDGNHYCKLLSPARIIEWVYMDGLKKNLWKVWKV